MKKRRIERLNSLLKEVISEVITTEVKNPDVSTFVTVTKVEMSNDAHCAKVFISVIGTQEEKTKTVDALESAAGYIAVKASKKVVMRTFPSLTFKLDNSVDQHLRIDEILQDIRKEEKNREHHLSDKDQV